MSQVSVFVTDCLSVFVVSSSQTLITGLVSNKKCFEEVLWQVTSSRKMEENPEHHAVLASGRSASFFSVIESEAKSEMTDLCLRIVKSVTQLGQRLLSALEFASLSLSCIQLCAAPSGRRASTPAWWTGGPPGEETRTGRSTASSSLVTAWSAATTQAQRPTSARRAARVRLFIYLSRHCRVVRLCVQACWTFTSFFFFCCYWWCF